MHGNETCETPECFQTLNVTVHRFPANCNIEIVGINFSMMGYLNGNGKTFFVALQGILSTFLVRIPVSYFMSKIAGVTLFQIGFATPLAAAMQKERNVSFSVRKAFRSFSLHFSALLCYSYHKMISMYKHSF